MPSIERLLNDRVQAAIRAAFPDAADSPAIVQPSQDARFGDYQANGAMGLAKRLKKKPREVAKEIMAKLDVSPFADVDPEPAGPGFINMRLRPDWVSAELGRINPGDRLGIDPAAQPETMIVDYSAPNIAKEMHVGHLRSTIIGDALVRILEFAGHNVIRQNHVGDWGTQFGKVILAMWHLCMAREKRREPDYIKRTLDQIRSVSQDDPVARREAALSEVHTKHQADLNDDPNGERFFDPWVQSATSGHLSLSELLEAYQFVTLVEQLADGTSLEITHSRPDKNPVVTPFSKVSSRITAMMQKGGGDNQQEQMAWRYSIKISLVHCEQVYDRLGVLLTDADIRGESAYNADLPRVLDALQSEGLLQESQGAQCVFLPEFKGKEGEPLPLIVQKSDEGFLYATTDLAAIRYRTGTLHANRILYVVGSPQALHFQMVFAVARKAGFAPPDVQLEHVAFGSMLGADGKPFKTRVGGTVKLMELLDEAEQKAFDLVSAKSPDVAEDERKKIAHIVGIGAVKYADLSQNRTSDYVFSWEKMLSLDGNTAPYMQYAYARVRSIFRKGSHEAEDHRADSSPLALGTPQELALGKMILRFPETLDRALNDYRPNVLAAYLYDLAGAFTAFYDACPVIQSEESVRSQRLKLCDLTARVIAKGLGLLGIETAERM